MKILALDTATQSCSVAIVDDGVLLIEIATGIDQTHSRHLLDLIMSAVGIVGLKISDLDGFAVTIGPGSFTGLRIGISTIKGLAFASGKPTVGISSLTTLAWQCAQSRSLICAMLDARKHEVYYCRYRFQGDKLNKEEEEQVASPKQALRGIGEPCIFVGSGAQIYHEIISAEMGEYGFFASPSQHMIRASSVAYLSLNRFEQQDTDDFTSLAPLYVRKSDVLLKARPRLNSKPISRMHLTLDQNH
jgi:tRNA threonylcarbamoyladenosine biosynthesis protein TsaB